MSTATLEPPKAPEGPVTTRNKSLIKNRQQQTGTNTKRKGWTPKVGPLGRANPPKNWRKTKIGGIEPKEKWPGDESRANNIAILDSHLQKTCEQTGQALGLLELADWLKSRQENWRPLRRVSVEDLPASATLARWEYAKATGFAEIYRELAEEKIQREMEIRQEVEERVTQRVRIDRRKPKQRSLLGKFFEGVIDWLSM